MPSSIQHIASSENIRRAYLVSKLRYAMLKARCQSGKTGCYQHLIRSMIRNGDIKTAIILCGSNELQLRSQAIDDTIEHNKEYYDMGLITILFRQDFNKSDLIIENSLIVVDESHLDQTEGQQLSQLLSRHGLSMDGNSVILNEKNIYMLSVDATPYAEEAALLLKETPFDKHVESLEPGEGYYGLEEYKFSGKLLPTFEISRNKAKMTHLLSTFKNKYGILRLNKSASNMASLVTLKEICRENNYKMYEYSTDCTSIAITRKEQESIRKEERREVPCLEDAPTVTSIVIIHGRLRAGKVVPKKHIGFVWEGAKMSKTDSLVQGLPGRMCGYEFGDEKPLIFIPESSLKMNENKVVKASEIDRVIIGTPELLPTKGTNLKKPIIASSAKNGSTQCPPIRLSYDVDDEEWKITDGKVDRELVQKECYRLLLKNSQIIHNHPTLSDKQKEEILQEIIPRGSTIAHTRQIGKDSSPSAIKWLKEIIKSEGNNTSCREHIDDNPEMTFITAEKKIFVIFYTKAHNILNMKSIDIHSRIPQTNGKSIFSFKEKNFERPIVAAGGVGFDENCIRSPQNFKNALRDYLSLWKTSPLVVSKEIRSNKDKFTFDKRTFRYIDTKKNEIENISKELSEEFQVKIKIKYARSSIGKDGHFNVKSLSW